MSSSPQSLLPFESVLVASDFAPSGRIDLADRRISVLLAQLRAGWPDARLVVAASESTPRSDRGVWVRGLGAEFASGPLDWDGWHAARRLEFGVVILAGAGVLRRMLPAVRRYQPQALVVADAPHLPDASYGSTDDFPIEEERRGAQLAASRKRSSRRETAVGSDVLLVRSAPLGAAFGMATCVFGGLVDAPLGAAPAGRSGVLVVADLTSHDCQPRDFALRSLPEIVSVVHRRLGGVPFRMVVDDPWPPLIGRLEPFVEVIRDVDLVHEVRTTRLILDVMPRYSSPSWLQLLAAEHGAPVVAADVSQPRVADQIVRLLQSESTWARAVHDAGRCLPAIDQDRDELSRLLSKVGFAPATAGGELGPFVSGPSGLRHPRRGDVQGQIQTAGLSERRPMEPTAAMVAVDDTLLRPDVGYRWWLDSRPVTPQVAAELRATGSDSGAPLISLLMPVYNTAPDVLETTIRSVRDQLYRRWELCVVDDGSTSAETLRALERQAALDLRIRVAHLPVNCGIAGASNAALAMATGEFIALIDHDDLLMPEALAEVARVVRDHPDIDFIYSDEDKLDAEGRITTPFFKPSWSPDLHLCVNYVTHLAVYRRALVHDLDGFRSGFDGSQDYDLSLRVTEETHRVGHIAKPIYRWRMVAGSAAVAHDAKPYAIDAARRALDEAMARRWPGGHVQPGRVPGSWRARYPIVGEPLVSILIATRNRGDLLAHCIESVRERTTYERYELVIVDNCSDDPATLAFLSGLNAAIVRYPYRFNYARQMNLAADAAQGSILLMLNNDMEVIEEGWLEAMIEHAQRPEVGAIGARLLFPGGNVQHEGVFVGFGGGMAGNVDFGGYLRLGEMERNCSAVTGACMATRADVFESVGGLDEHLRVAFNDVDYCLRLRQRGYRIVYTPYAELFHAESASRGSLHPMEDEAYFAWRWGDVGEFVDPFYNPNLDPKRPFCLSLS